ncbi:agmatinase [Suttonella sp. R2A3]|uniref:agmatinase n=1 Tax=Suttonella sp. R2A3 TaxID=2908648 RepID=UPI001F31775A|nr:agmatinase [Suttonella sp. R2A3]UJF25043.1 agmatinase [Suttonella sp. R2A3]
MGIFLGSEIEQPQEDQALFHIVPVPYEHSVSYGSGTSLGPAAIIEASDQLETTDGVSEPCNEGIYTHPAIDCSGDPEAIMQRIRSVNGKIAARKQIPVVLGGEHTVSYGAVMGVADAYPEQKIGIVQFDAHADLRDSYEGSKWSHASVMKRLVDEGMSLFQLGVRAMSVEEQAVRDAHSDRIHYLDARCLCRQNPTHSMTLPEDFPELIYITVDIDGLDGAIMPATGTPVPGGLSYWQMIDLLESVIGQRQVVGMDVVELAPIDGFHVYDYTTAEVVYKMMGLVSRARD